jgi:uncharacterized protein (DUF4415 family)
MSAKRAATKTAWVDPDDAPELTDEALDEAELYEGDKFIRRGRPKLGAPKNQVTLRLDPDVLDALRAGGPGWQSRLNFALRKHLKLGARKVA